MNVLEAIRTRRGIGKMTAQRPTRAQIETILEVATHAPNHHNTQPWQFFVLAGESRKELGKIMAESLAAKLEDTTSEKAQGMLQKEAFKLQRSPVVIAVASLKPIAPNVVDIENVEAVSAGVQNMLLAAHELGLASMWRTGDPVYDPKVKAYFGLSASDHLVGFVYLGYAAIPSSEREPIPFAQKTRWLGWED